MSDNLRYHSKLHGKAHHTDATGAYYDSATDPIASSGGPFRGDFHLSGAQVIYELPDSINADTSAPNPRTLSYDDFIRFYDGTYTTVRDTSGSWSATGNSKWTLTGNYLYSNTIVNYLGVGTQTPNEMLTVTGNISSGNIVYDISGTSSEWNSSYTTVNQSSGGWEENRLDITEVANASADWNSTHTTVNDNSANWTWVAENSGATPAGILIPFAGSVSPEGYLLCDGSEIDRIIYSRLFAVISTTYGIGDGSNTFNLPDLRGRVPAGRDNMGGSAANRLTNPATTVGGVSGDILGATGGEEAHQITVPELAAHTHTQDYTYGVYANQYDRTGGHVATRDSGSTGDDVAHNTVQPTLILNYIIKT